MGERAWLPNLAGGVSVWNLARDLNRPELFDGSLLVPRLEGPVNLPASIEWNVTGLLPLAEARLAHPQQIERALDDFVVRLDRAAALFEEGGGFERYRGAFTLPKLESDNYFFDPVRTRLCVKNWGAAPRRIAQRTDDVIDSLRFAELARVPSAPARVLAPSRKRGRIALLALPLLALAALLAFWLARSPEPARRERRAQLDAPPAVPPVHVPPPLPAPHQKIYFALGDDRLGDDQLASLTAVRAYLVDHPEVHRVRVEGHADYRGSEPDNFALSAERATRVCAWLVEHGVERARVEAFACSELYPLANESTRGNRRVEFFVVEPDIAPRPHPSCRPVSLR